MALIAVSLWLVHTGVKVEVDKKSMATFKVDFHFGASMDGTFRSHTDTSLHCETTHTGLVRRVVSVLKAKIQYTSFP